MKITTKYNIGDWVYGSIDHTWPPDHYGEIVYWYSPIKLQVHAVEIYTDGLHEHTRVKYECLPLVNDFPEGKFQYHYESSLYLTPEEWWDHHGGVVTPHGMIVGEFNKEIFDLLSNKYSFQL